MPQGHRDQCSIVKCRLSGLHRLLCAPQQDPREDKNTNFELGSRRFTCFESRGYQAAVPEVKQEEQRGSRIRQTPKSCQPSREGREGGGRASLQRATCLHPCEEPLAFPRSCWCPGDREGSQPARLWPAEVQAGAGNH